MLRPTAAPCRVCWDVVQPKVELVGAQRCARPEQSLELPEEQQSVPRLPDRRVTQFVEQRRTNLASRPMRAATEVNGDVARVKVDPAEDARGVRLCGDQCVTYRPRSVQERKIPAPQRIELGL